MGSLIGKRRKRDRTGETVGPYVVAGPVGDNWQTSIYWRVQCPDCGHELQVQTKHIHTVAARKHCGGCSSKIYNGPHTGGRPRNPTCPRCKSAPKHPRRGYCARCEHERQTERYHDPARHEEHKRTVREYMRRIRAERKAAA